MGRYYNFDTGESGKFWFGVQPSTDLLEFGEETESSMIRVNVPYDNLEDIEKKIKKLKQNFKRFKITYEGFMKKMDKKGYTSSSKDKETETKKWNKMCREASLIELGLKIVKSLKENETDLYIEGEC